MTRKIVVLTGANRGIGLEIARHLNAQGYAIAALVRTTSDSLEALLATDPNSARFEMDLSDSASVGSAAKSMLKWAGSIDGLVNCAGQATGGLFTMTRSEDIRALFDVNFFNQIQLMQLVARKMIRAKSGSIVNITSTAGLMGDAGTLSYGSSKAAMNHATRVAATELGAFNIRVNAIAPAVVETEMATLMDAGARQKLEDRSALAGPTEAQDVAALVEFLLSSASAKLTGQVIRLDRGMPF